MIMVLVYLRGGIGNHGVGLLRGVSVIMVLVY